MTEKELRQKVLTIMQSWLGYSEANGKFKEILDIYNNHKPLPRGAKMLTTYEWCAATVSAAFIKAGLADIGFKECSCSKMIDLYKAKGRWKEADNYVPKIGDVIMYDWQDRGVGDNTGAPDHVGIVAALEGTSLIIIEGNKGEAVAYRALTVNGKYIRGYCLPDYASKAAAGQGAGQGSTASIRIAAAKSFDRAYAKTYTVTASALNLRSGAGTDKTIIKSLPKSTKVTCYGYYTQNGATAWLYVKTADGALGFCSKKYLK